MAWYRCVGGAGGSLKLRTASGRIATFSTNMVEPFKSLKSDINPVQSGSGTPSPQNVRPISGFSALNVTRTGKNLWGHNDVTIESAAYVINNEDICLPAGTYVIQWKFSGTTGASSGRIDDVDGNAITTFGGNISVGLNIKTITIPTGKTGVKFKFYSAAIGTYSDFEISIGSTTPDFEPYNGQTATVNFGQTVYGGVADVTNGKVTITHKLVDLGTLTNWVKDTSSLSVTVFRSYISDRKAGSSYFICSQYQTLTTGRNGLINNDGAIASWNITDSPIIAIRDDSLSSGTADDFKTAMSGVQLVYELATPIEITTTPETLSAIVGQNNVYGDTNGDSEVKYLYRE